MKLVRLFVTGVLLLVVAAVSPSFARSQQDKEKQQEPPKQQQPPPKQQEQPKQQPQQQPRSQPEPRQQQPPPKQQPQQQPRSQPEPRQPQQQPQQQPKQQPQPRQQQQPPPKQQPAPKQQSQPRQQPQQSSGGAYHGGVRPTAPTNGGVHPSGVPQHSGQVRSGFTQSRATSWSTQHRSWQQRGGYNGYRIPDDRFSLYFGPSHFFRMSALPMLFVGGYPRFQYDGYWVTFVDPWPENWPPDWYETDDIYIAYTDDGYYVYDQNYPGIGIAVTISQ
jgi:hypothetical protein